MNVGFLARLPRFPACQVFPMQNRSAARSIPTLHQNHPSKDLLPFERHGGGPMLTEAMRSIQDEAMIVRDWQK